MTYFGLVYTNISLYQGWVQHFSKGDHIFFEVLNVLVMRFTQWKYIILVVWIIKDSEVGDRNLKGTQKFNMAAVFWLIFAYLWILIIKWEDATFESLGIFHNQNFSSVHVVLELYWNWENQSCFAYNTKR